MIQQMKTKSKSHTVPLLILILPILMFHQQILWMNGVICGGDFINQFVPWRKFALTEFSAGRLPGWNPYTFSGAPFLANIQTSLWYPVDLLHTILQPERVFSVSLALHHILAAVGMYGFLVSLFRTKPGALIGALVYTWSGFFMTHAHDGHLIHVIAYAWIPYVLWAQNGLRHQWNWQYMLGMSCALAAMFYGGHTQIPLYIFYVVVFRSLWWGWLDYFQPNTFLDCIQSVLKTGLALAVSILISLPVLLPLYEISKHTAGRAGGAAYSFTVSDSMPPSHAVTLVAPFFYGDPTAPERESQFWETRTGYHEICGYTGIISIVLLIFTLTRRPTSFKQMNFKQSETIFFCALALGGVFFALGEYNPLYPLLYYGLPGWSFFRVPGRLLLLWIIGISVCSARGWQMVSCLPLRTLCNMAGFQLASVFSAVVTVLTVILYCNQTSVIRFLREIEVNRTIELFQLPPGSRLKVSLQLPEILFETRFDWMLQSGVIACAFILTGWLCLLLHNRLKSNWSWLPCVLILLLDLMIFSHRFIEVKPLQQWRDTYFPQTELVQYLQENAKGYRVLCLDDAIGNPGLETHPELRPNRLMYYGIESARGYDPLINQTYTRWVNRMYGNPPDAPQGGLLFFSYIHPEQIKQLNIMNVKYIVTTQELQEPYMQVWNETTSQVKIYENPQCFNRLFWEAVSQENRIEIVAQTPQSITARVFSSKQNRLIYSQTIYPGWRVEVDGAQTHVEAYQDTFVSVQVSAGEQDVTFSFHPNWLPSL